MIPPSILAVRPAPLGAGRAVAFVDVQLDGLRLFNLKLVDGPSGRRIHAPSAYGSSVATLTPELAAELVCIATQALGDIAQHDRLRSAA
jgi:hypothetical protein